MTVALVDVVNFNADASCLPAARWLEALRGGTNSEICRWLRAFVDLDKKVTLGLVGATAIDVATFNPEAIALIKAHPAIFEVILRPFSHDIALLHEVPAFRLNVLLGRRVLERELGTICPYFLPPEFMLTNEQVALLGEEGIAGTFIMARRFREDVAARLPREPYLLSGLFGATLRCLPVDGRLTEAYLESLHDWDNEAWHGALSDLEPAGACSWRDGESWLFLPDGLARERAWLENEQGVERSTVRDWVATRRLRPPGPEAHRSYPVHSFSDWVREFRMLGFLRRLAQVERRLEALSITEQVLWLCAANSDILSAVEKDAPTVAIQTRPPGDPARSAVRWTIQRSERGFEGEELLALVERFADPEVRSHLASSDDPHMVKLRARIAWFDAP